MGPDTLDDKAITEMIAQLFNGTAGSESQQDLLREIITTVLKLSQDHPDGGDLKIIHHAFKEMRFGFKLFSPYRHIRKVSIFGSARTPSDEPTYQQAELFARKIAEKGFMVITGAGEGIMKGAQGGAGRERSFGININLPFEQTANQFIQNDHKLMTFKYFFTRKLFFIKEADALVLFPGGFGTHDEAFEALTLIQTGKTDPIPVVFLDAPGGTYWKAWEAHLHAELLGKHLISAEDIHLFKVMDNASAAAEEIVRFYANYHSQRYVEEDLIIRMHRPAEEGMLRRLNTEFSDILSGGQIEATTARPEEAYETEIADLPRMALRFNRKNFGRLRQLIDVVNLY